MSPDLDAVLAPLRPGYAGLFAALAEALRELPAVAAVHLTGSIGAGAADAYSDLDLRVVVDGATVDEATDAIEGVVRASAEVVLAKRLRGPALLVLHVVTADWLRVDLAVTSEPVAPAGPALLVWERPGVALGPAPEPRAASPAMAAELATEFLRVLGLAEVVLGRGELHVAVEGVVLLRGMLASLLLLEAGQDVPRGVKRLNPFLPPESRAVLASQPPLPLDEDGLLVAYAAVAGAFAPRVRAYLAAQDLPYPVALADATRRRLAATVGLELPSL